MPVSTSSLHYSNINEFAQKFSRLQDDNDALRRQLSEERHARASAQAMLSHLLDQVQAEGVDVIHLAPDTSAYVQSADIRVFAERSVRFCEQMKDFASHILTFCPIPLKQDIENFEAVPLQSDCHLSICNGAEDEENFSSTERRVGGKPLEAQKDLFERRRRMSTPEPGEYREYLDSRPSEITSHWKRGKADYIEVSRRRSSRSRSLKQRHKSRLSESSSRYDVDSSRYYPAVNSYMDILCPRFNEGKCRLEQCNRLHICSFCSSEKHSVLSCPSYSSSKKSKNRK